MKMFKRLAAFTIVLSMVLTMLPTTVSAAELPTDVKGTRYEDAASLLCALEIMVGDGEKFNPDNNVTRAEFAKILVTTMGHLDTASAFTAQGIFDDVLTSEWYAPFVEFAAQIGAINGYGDGKFGPNDNVTGYQAIKMICFASGHNACIDDPIAGYPQEYFNVAKEYGFLKSLSDANFSEPMTRGQVAVLVANVLKVDMLKLVGSSSDSGSSYAVMEGVNLLSSKHNVYKFEGLVTTNEKTGLFGASNLDAGEVRIEKGADVRVFFTGESGIEDAIGTYVKAYYKDDDNLGTKTVVSFDESSTKNTKIELALDFIDADESTDTLVKYWADGDKASKTKKMEIIKNVPVIWNGASSSLLLMEAISDAQGMQSQIEFLDYNGDGTMDIVSITAYDTFIIERMDIDNYIITDKAGDWSAGTGKAKTKKLTLDEEDETKIITISDTDGIEYEFEELEIGDVLSVAASKDEKVFDVKVSMDKVEGTINSIGVVDGKWVFEIDGKDYNLSKSYAEYITKGKANATIADLGVKINKSYEFKLDVFGQLAFSDTVAGDAKGEFGFITFYAPSEGVDSGISVRMFSDGEVNIYGLADTVTIDGNKCKGELELKAAMDEIGNYKPVNNVKKSTGYYGDNSWSGIPVLFELNDEGKIKYIDTPVLGKDEDKYTLQPVRGQTDDIISSTGSSSGFGSKRPFASTLNVIQLPGKDSELNVAEKYSTAKSFNSSTTYYVQLFSTDPEAYTTNYVIVARGANGSKDITFQTNIELGLDDSETVNGGNSNAGVKTTPLFVVKGVRRSIVGEDDEETILIEGFENGAEVTYTVDPDYYASGLIMKTLENYIKQVDASAVLNSARTAKIPVMEGDVLRLARNKTTKYVTFIAPVFYMAEKALYAQVNNGYLDCEKDPIYCAIDVATVKEMNGNQGVLSYLIKNYKASSSHYNKWYSGMITFDEDGRIVPPAEEEDAVEGTDDITDVIKTDTGYEGDFTKLHNIGNFTKIATYDASEPAGKRVSKGSLSDIITLDDATNKTNPSIILFHYRTQSDANYSMVILNF